MRHEMQEIECYAHLAGRMWASVLRCAIFLPPVFYSVVNTLEFLILYRRLEALGVGFIKIKSTFPGIYLIVSSCF